ncbi:MAG: hypothetical protein ACTS22_09915 [Phycisphaerales bacterium]
MSRAAAVLFASIASCSHAQQGVLLERFTDLVPEERLHFGLSVDVSDDWIAIGTGSPSGAAGAARNRASILRHARGTGVIPWQRVFGAFTQSNAFSSRMYDIAVSSRGLVMPFQFVGGIVCQPQLPPNSVINVGYWILDGDAVFVKKDYPFPVGQGFCNGGPFPGAFISLPLGGQPDYYSLEVGEFTENGIEYTQFSDDLRYDPVADELVIMSYGPSQFSVSAARVNQTTDQKGEWLLSGLSLWNDAAGASGGAGLTATITSASVSSNGRWVAAGAPYEVNPNTPSAPAEGVVYIFERTPPNSSLLTLRQILNASTVQSLTAGSEFGFSVAIENDALAVGAPGQSWPGSSMLGTVHTFVFSNAGTWVYQGGPGASPPNPPLHFTGAVDPTPSNSVRNRFGESIALKNNTLAVGIPIANVDGVEAAGVVEFYAIPEAADCDDDGVSDIFELESGTEIDLDLNGIPDSCQITDGESDCNGNGVIDDFEFTPLMDVLVVFDSSGSLQGEGDELCGAVNQIRYALADEGIPSRVTILTIEQDDGMPGPNVIACESDWITNLYCSPGSVDPANTSACDAIAGGGSPDEAWAPATEIAARSFDWLPNATRVVIPVSDEGPLGGSTIYNPTGCSSQNPTADELAVCTLVDAALSAGVRVVPIAGDGTPSDVRSWMQLIANVTSASGNGVVVDLTNGVDDLSATLIDVANAETPVAEDCNANGLIDGECDCLADVNLDGIVEPGDFAAWTAAYNLGDLAADQNCNGTLEPNDYSAFVANYNAAGVGPCP